MNEIKQLELLNEIVEKKVNPILNTHLGSVKVTYVEENTAYVKFSGSCRSCYYATDTLDNTVKDIILSENIGITDVRIDDTVENDLLDFAKNLLKKDK
jgi:Fe-S cluster biogenesis protein NfuA